MMRTSKIGLAGAVVLFVSSLANAQQPAPPQVTMGADIKLLRFDWEPVPGAAFYQLKFRPRSNLPYQLIGERIPASVTQTEQAVPVHLQDWSGMRFIVAACNSAGCTNSAALNPRPLMLETIGYLKASNSERDDQFGQGVALSADGYTLAVSSWFEDSNATGVNGDQANNLSDGSGAVYVFRRRGNAWHQEAYLKAGANEPRQGFGVALEWDYPGMALSADGSILATTAPRQDVNGLEDAGVVYVFRRTQNTWRLVATLHSLQPRFQEYFGSSLDMSHDGRTLKVMSTVPQNAGPLRFRTHIFVRPGDTWQHSVTLAPADPVDACQSTRLSADGQTLVTSCMTTGLSGGRIETMKRAGNAWVRVANLPTAFHEIRQPIGLNADATALALVESRAPNLVGIYRWNGANWTREAGLPGPPSTDPFFIGNWGYNFAFDASGQLLALSDPQAREANAGISATIMPSTAELGAIYLYQRNAANNSWSLRNVVKSARPGHHDYFGISFSLSASGRTLAVGAPGEDSNATGIDGDRDNGLAPGSGAAYLY